MDTAMERESSFLIQEVSGCPAGPYTEKARCSGKRMSGAFRHYPCNTSLLTQWCSIVHNLIQQLQHLTSPVVFRWNLCRLFLLNRCLAIRVNMTLESEFCLCISVSFTRFIGHAIDSCYQPVFSYPAVIYTKCILRGHT